MKSDIELLVEHFPTANYLNGKNIENWIEYLGIYGKLTPSSINRVVGSSRSFFKFLKSEKEIPKTEIDPFVVPEKYRILAKIVDTNNDDIITDEEITNAIAILERAKKEKHKMQQRKNFTLFGNYLQESYKSYN
jgi:site-specific recombinase XerD